jgi:cysteine desulfurase
MKVYMDHGSGCPVDINVLEEMNRAALEIYGNPSSYHSAGFTAQKTIAKSRGQVASLIDSEPEEIFFTASATEATNLALIGGAQRFKNKGNRIVISAIEHITTINVAKELSRQGFEYQTAPVDSQGILKLDKLEELVTDKTLIVSVMTANGEMGTIQPIKEAADIAHRKGALLHTDATAALGKISLNPNQLGADMMTLSSNDIYGPKGVGGLYLRKNLRVRPVIIGGGQEQGIRSGTENTPGIIGFGVAAEIAKREMPEESRRLAVLRDRLIKGILTTIPEAYLNGHSTLRLPHNANIRFNYIEGEALVLSLDNEDIAVGTGSACAAKTLEPSACLLAMGLKHEEAHGSLVFTLGKQNNNDQVDYVIDKLPGIVKRLRAMSPLTPEELK